MQEKMDTLFPICLEHNHYGNLSNDTHLWHNYSCTQISMYCPSEPLLKYRSQMLGIVPLLIWPSIKIHLSNQSQISDCTLCSILLRFAAEFAIVGRNTNKSLLLVMDCSGAHLSTAKDSWGTILTRSIYVHINCIYTSYLVYCTYHGWPVFPTAGLLWHNVFRARFCTDIWWDNCGKGGLLPVYLLWLARHRLWETWQSCWDPIWM